MSVPSPSTDPGTPVGSQGDPSKKAQEPKGSLGSRAVSWISNKWSNASTLKKVGIVTTVALAVIGAVALTHGAALIGIGALILSGTSGAIVTGTAVIDKAVEDVKTPEVNSVRKNDPLQAVRQRAALGDDKRNTAHYKQRMNQHNYMAAVHELVFHEPKKNIQFYALKPHLIKSELDATKVYESLDTDEEKATFNALLTTHSGDVKTALIETLEKHNPQRLTEFALFSKKKTRISYSRA